MDGWIRYQWIETVLSNFNRDAETPIMELQELLPCQVLNVKVYNKAINGVAGMCEVHDNKLYIKALFTDDAIKRFEAKEELTTCAEFTDLKNSILSITKYHIMTDVFEKIEQSDIAICVEEFTMDVYKVSPGTRRVPLVRALDHPTVAHDLRRMWRAKYRPDEQDTCFSDAEDLSQESPTKSALSQLLDAMENSSTNSQQPSQPSEGEPEDDALVPVAGPSPDKESLPSKNVFEMEVDKGTHLDGLSDVEVLKQVLVKVKRTLILVKNFPELTTNKIPETLKDAQSLVVECIPANKVKSFTGVSIDPADCDIPHDITEKLNSIEEWKVGYIPPSSQPTVSSPSNEAISFMTEPSAEDHKEDDEQQAQGKGALQSCKRKLSFDQSAQSPCKIAKNSECSGNDIINVQDNTAPSCIKQKESSKSTHEECVPEQDDVAQMSEAGGGGETTSELYGTNVEGMHSRTNESISEEDGMKTLCDCLTPSQEQEGVETQNQQEQFPASDSSKSDSLVVSCEAIRQDSMEDKRGDEERNQEQEVTHTQNHQEANSSLSLLASCKIRIQDSIVDQRVEIEPIREQQNTETQNHQESSSSSDASNSDSLLLSCEARGQLSDEDQRGDQESPEEAKGPRWPTVEITSDGTTDFQDEDSRLLESEQVSPTSCQQSRTSSTCTTAHDSNQNLQTVNFQAAGNCPKVVSADVVLSKTALEQTSDRHTSKTNSELIGDAKLPKPEQKRPPPSSSDTRKHGVEPLGKTAHKISTTKSIQDVFVSHPKAKLHSQSALGSIALPLQPPVTFQSSSTPRSEASSSKSSEKLPDGSGDDEDDRASRLRKFKLEEYLLEWCSSYFESLHRLQE